MAPLSDDYTLTVRQAPERAKVAGVKEKDRKPVDPPPIVQIHVSDPFDPAQNYLQSPYLFMCVNLCNADAENPKQLDTQSFLSGSLVSSLHRLKDVDNSDGGFFVFGDLSVRVEGEYRLRFSLFEMCNTEVVYIKSILSSPFEVWTSKSFPGMLESTFLSRSFGDQGRPHPAAIRPEDMPPSFEDPAPPTQRDMTLQSQRSQVGTYEPRYAGEPSHKRQRTSVDFGDRGVHDPDRYGQRSYLDQRGSLGSYTPRDQIANTFNPTYGQASQSTMSNVSEYSFGHQRTNSSSASSPFISPHLEVSGHSWPAGNIFYQPSFKEPVYNYPQNQSQNQYNHMQLHQPPQVTNALPHYRSQSFTSRLPMNSNFTFPRPQDSDGPAAVNYNHTGRPLPVSSNYDESSLRLPSTDQLGDLASSTRQQYPTATMSNVLPPLESTLSSTQPRGGSQQVLPSHVIPSIEPQSLDPHTNQQTQERAAEGYDSTAFGFSLPDPKRPEQTQEK
ncbi:MAG: hypothetical protein Q9186_000482 [Xanthomendoza sp. 1 TL-2023]